MLLVAALLVLGPVRVELERRFEVVRSEAIARLEELLGRSITYARISPSILRYLSVRDLTVHGRAGEPADLLSVQQLRIYYRPLMLLQGRLTDAISEIRIENTTLTVDTRLDSDLTALLADIAGSREAQGDDSVAAVLPDDVIVSGRNIQLQVRSAIGMVEMDRLFFSTTLAEDIVTLRGQGDLRLTETGPDFPLQNVSGRVEADGTINVASGDTLLEVSLAELSSTIATVRNQVLQVRYSDGVLEARNVQSRDPVDIYVRYIDEAGELYARILADGYRLDELLELEGDYAGLNPYLRLPFRGQANATITPDALAFGGSLRTVVRDVRDLPDGDLTLTFDGTTEAVSIDRLAYDTALGSVSYSGLLELAPLRPSGSLSLRNVVYGGIDPLSVNATLRSTGDSIAVSAQPFTYAGTRFRSLAGNLALAGTLNGSLVADIDGMGDARIEVETSHAPDGALRTARVDARRVVPDRLVEIQQALLPNLALPDISVLPDAMIVDTRVLVDLTDGVGVEIPLFYAFDAAQPGDHLSFSLRYDDGSVDVRDVTASYGGYDGAGDFVAQIDPSGSVLFTSDVVVEGIPYEFDGVFEPDNSLEISGLYDVDARFYFGERGELIFRASGDVPVPVAGARESRLAFAADGFYFSPDDWSVDVERFVATGIPYATVPAATLALGGTFTPSGATLTSVGYADEFSSLSGNGEISWDLNAPAGTVALVLSGDETEAVDRASTGTNGNGVIPPEAYELSASYADGVLDARARIVALPLLRVGVETVRGALSGSASIAGPLDQLSTTVDASLVNGKFNNDPLELAALVELTPDAITVRNGNARYIRNRATGVTGSLSYADGAVSLAGTYVQPGEAEDLQVGIEADGLFEGLSGPVDVLTADFSGSLIVSGLPVREDFPADWRFNLSREEGTTTAVGGPGDALALSVTSDGAFTGRVAEPLPVRFDAVGFLEGGAIEADITRLHGDVPRLWALVNSPDFTFVNGTARGSLRIVGPLNDPDFYGTLIAEEVTATLGIIPAPMGPARTFLVFDEKLLTVRETTVPVGSGRARVSVEAILDRWIPTQYRVAIATERGAPVPIANDFGGVAIDGFATGSVTVTGEAATVLVSGDVTATSTDITLSDRPEARPAGSTGQDLRVDMLVRTARGVQFLWPTNTFPILRGFADSNEAVRITHESAANTFSVTGEVEIQGGEIFYFDRSFYIREGRMTFEEDEQEFDPTLTVDAEIREVADEGPVEIYLVADERPLSEFTPRWRSDPPLSEAAILALLGGNVFVSESGDPIDIQDAVLLGSDVLSQFAIIRGFESSVREALQLDLFSIRTQLFQNLLRGVIVADDDFRDGDYPLDNTAPSLGEY
ncbi:MAG: translocation/assembly module TamB domain-containing protein, partial [Spirochaetota bacterium]